MGYTLTDKRTERLKRRISKLSGTYQFSAESVNIYLTAEVISKSESSNFGIIYNYLVTIKALNESENDATYYLSAVNDEEFISYLDGLISKLFGPLFQSSIQEEKFDQGNTPVFKANCFEVLPFQNLIYNLNSYKDRALFYFEDSSDKAWSSGSDSILKVKINLNEEHRHIQLYVEEQDSELDDLLELFRLHLAYTFFSDTFYTQVAKKFSSIDSSMHFDAIVSIEGSYSEEGEWHSSGNFNILFTGMNLGYSEHKSHLRRVIGLNPSIASVHRIMSEIVEEVDKAMAKYSDTELPAIRCSVAQHVDEDDVFEFLYSIKSTFESTLKKAPLVYFVEKQEFDECEGRYANDKLFYSLIT